VLAPERVPVRAPLPPPHAEAEEAKPGEAMSRLRELMSANVGVIRDGAGLAAALAELTQIASSEGASRTLSNMALAARFVAAAAYVREESRGGHYRSDFPEPREEFAQRSYLTLEDVDAIAAEIEGAKEAKTNIVRAEFGS
jgi:L-aspartate oxidase